MICWARWRGRRFSPGEWPFPPSDVPPELEYELPTEFGILEEHWDVRRYGTLLCNLVECEVPFPGMTPILDVGGAWLKLEYLNPTGSFKDRGVVTGLPQKGEKICIDSSGNAAISFSSYGRACGYDVEAFVPRTASPAKLRILEKLGVKVKKCADRADAHRCALGCDGKYVGHWVNPFFLIGMRTLAFEVLEQKGDAPRTVLVPVGSGSLLLGLYMGFRDLLELNEIDEMPVFIAVRAYGYDEVFGLGGERAELPEGLHIPLPPRWKEIKDAVDETGGWAVGVSDPEVREAMRELWDMGILIEETAAAAPAALKKLEADVESPILIPLTGSGIKQ